MPEVEPAALPRFTVAVLVYPNMALLDLVGPQAVWGFHADTYLVWQWVEPILTEGGVTIVPTHSFNSCPRGVDILFVPGGVGAWDILNNDAALLFVSEQTKDARYVTCLNTGSIILAAAGSLEGRRAATHRSAYPNLKELGVAGVHRRVVMDGNRISGGGVTAGIEFGLTILADLRGEEVAKTTQLMLEYCPEPPFNAGSPDRDGDEIVGLATAPFGDMTDRTVVTVGTAKKRLEAMTA